MVNANYVTGKPFVVRLLQLAGDVELNPGPEKDLLQAMESLKAEILKEMKNTGRELREELLDLRKNQSELKTSCSDLKKEFQNLKTSVDTIKSEINELKEENRVAEYDLAAISPKLDEICDRMDRLEDDTDRLESFSRRDNVRLYGINEEPGETFDQCKKKVVEI
ncbi:uncharacterized protein [Ptychodera flava]|uniref:uncharacterized protein n=1 Tax=Ptychodera flava TaxID=63121 RepID=UPI00396A9C3D